MLLRRKHDFVSGNRFDPVTGCWNWIGRRGHNGYGITSYMGNNNVRVHRLSAHFYLGFDLKSNLLVCHRCDNPACFNPKHLFIGTISANAVDSVKKGRHAESKKTHCPQGHEYNEQNTYSWRPNVRRCRVCNAEAQKRRKIARMTHRNGDDGCPR